MPNETDSAVKNGNGGSVTWRWLAIAAVAALSAIGSYSYNELNARQVKIEDETHQRLTQLEVAHAQTEVRAALEYRSIEERLKRIESTIGRIEETLNRRHF